MDATEYVGRRAERALGALPALLVVAAAVGALAGLVQLWRLTAPSLGMGGPTASGSLWQRVTMGIGNGYDVTPLAWGGLAVAVLAALALTSRPGLPVPGPRVRRAAVVAAGAIVVLSVVAVVLVVAWALVSRGEVSFSFEAPGDQDGSRVTTQVGTYQTDVWAALVRVAPAVVAATLAVGAAAALLRPAPVSAPATVLEPVATPAEPAPRTEVEAWPDGPDATDPTPYDVPARDDGPAAARSGHRGSAGAERFARSLTPAGGAGGAGRAGSAGTTTPVDPLAGWTVGPGLGASTGSDVAFRRPGSAAPTAPTAPTAPAAPAQGAADRNGATHDEGEGAAATDRQAGARDPYRRPGA